MPLDLFATTFPNQNLGSGDELALAIEQYTGEVEGTIARRSVIKPYINMQSVRGTSTITNDWIGKSTLQKIVPGQTPDQDVATQFARNNLTVDTAILARRTLPMLDSFQTRYDVRAEIGREHGQEIAKFTDQALFIQALKSAALATPAAGAVPGHNGGSTKTLASSGDATDPAALYAAISDLMVQFETKDVDPVADGIVLVVHPAAYYVMMDAQQIVNSEYTTSDGNVINGAKLLKAFGVPILSSNNLPKTNITGHYLSNTRNSNAYDGDFTKTVALAFSPKAILAGETIPLTTAVFWDEKSKMWFIDAHLAFGATPNRSEYAGRIVLP